MTIRPAQLADVPELLELARGFHDAQALDELATFEPRWWRDLFVSCIEGKASHPGACFVSAVDGRAVGFALGFLQPMFWNPTIQSATVAALWVEPVHAAEAVPLLDAFTAWAMPRGGSVVAVQAGPGLGEDALSPLGFRRWEPMYSRTLPGRADVATPEQAFRAQHATVCAARARLRYADYDAAEAEFCARARGDAELISRLWAAEDPAEFAYSHVRSEGAPN